jgi:hypothetical protein
VLEEADHDCWLTLLTTQIPLQLITKLIRRSGTPPTRGVGLHIMVQQLHRIQLWAVAGQEMQLGGCCSASDSSVTC